MPTTNFTPASDPANNNWTGNKTLTDALNTYNDSSLTYNQSSEYYDSYDATTLDEYNTTKVDFTLASNPANNDFTAAAAPANNDFTASANPSNTNWTDV